MTAYVVGLHPEPCTHPDKWGVVGIFTMEELAKAECKDWRYWVAPIELDRSTGDEPKVWPNQSHPNVKVPA